MDLKLSTSYQKPASCCCQGLLLALGGVVDLFVNNTLGPELFFFHLGSKLTMCWLHMNHSFFLELAGGVQSQRPQKKGLGPGLSLPELQAHGSAEVRLIPKKLQDLIPSIMQA